MKRKKPDDGHLSHYPKTASSAKKRRLKSSTEEQSLKKRESDNQYIDTLIEKIKIKSHSPILFYITGLEEKNKKITGEGMEKFLTELSGQIKDKNIHGLSLDFSKSCFSGPEPVEKVVSFLEKYSHKNIVSEIDFSKNELLKNEHIRPIFDWLKQKKHSDDFIINLSSTKVGNYFLQELLGRDFSKNEEDQKKESPSLTIDLENSEISFDTLLYCFQNLTKLSANLSLYFHEVFENLSAEEQSDKDRNKLWLKIFYAFAQSIKLGKYREGLSITFSSEDINDSHIKSFKDKLLEDGIQNKQQRPLTVTLRDTLIGDQALKDLATVIESNQFYLNFHCADNENVTQEGMRYFAELMTSNNFRGGMSLSLFPDEEVVGEEFCFSDEKKDKIAQMFIHVLEGRTPNGEAVTFTDENGDEQTYDEEDNPSHRYDVKLLTCEQASLFKEKEKELTKLFEKENAAPGKQLYLAQVIYDSYRETPSFREGFLKYKKSCRKILAEHEFIQQEVNADPDSSEKNRELCRLPRDIQNIILLFAALVLPKQKKEFLKEDEPQAVAESTRTFALA